MGFGKTLLSRIRDGEPWSTVPLEADEVDVVDSVLEHLQNMLNTRRGSSAALPDYGVPDFNDLLLQFPAAIPEIRKQLKATIDGYEPRLSGVQVRHIPDADNPLALKFDISAYVVVGERRVKVGFESVLDDAGRIRVRR